MTVGLWGKHPSRPDFLRCDAGDISRLGFDRWLQAAFEASTLERGALPLEPTPFLYPRGDEALVGVLAPSRDSVGREFPLALAATVAPAGLRSAFPLFPLACAAFLDHASHLLRGAALLSVDELAAQVAGLPLEAWSSLARRDLDAYLLGTELNELEDAISSVPDELPYAVSTLLQACSEARADPSGATITVDAPAPSHGAAALWLELSRRGLRDSRTPACLWVREGPGRLLVSLGAPSPQLLAFLINPRHPSSSLWPLVTDVQAAREESRRRISPEQARLLATRGATIAEFLDVV